MNYIKHLTGFFNKINYEPNLNPTHISLYLALFQCWNVNRFKNPTGISREEIMKASKINSKATYHKCMKELELLGFMVYNPTFNPHACSNIIMTNFSEKEKTISKIPHSTHSKNEPVHNLTESKNEHVIEQVNEQLYIYNKKQTVKNNLNNTKIDIEKNLINQPVQNLNPIIIPKEIEIKTKTGQQKEKSCAKKEKVVELDLFFETTVPSLEMILEYFSFKESSQIEANKFFNYYSSIGWLIGGKTKMKDWKAAARNWMLNTAKFAANTQKTDYNAQPKPMHLHTATQKNYDEPL
ncbi:transcriptional regulator [Flavobacterium ranwuense]|uniref:Transcriptional regulator n=1 Tax=Flavobacterium ranwuense TaxID=2541725 RepID=A0ABY2DT76_9FLAO|nr:MULTISPECIES: transcriptional regulator [Flavobacterium]RTY87420.1 transcriptional regulator [Flavobacterium sp. RSP15]TDE30447.1 transcriptional regulator [Flavobacterium ranwuense]